MEPLALFRTLTVNTALTQAMRPLGAYLLSSRSGIDKRAREVVIARVCARNRCSYEWGVHVVVFGEVAELSDEQIAATAANEIDESLWRPREAALLRFADALCDTGTLGDGDWARIAEHFDDPQILTLLALAGWYHVISFVANGAAVQPEAWARTLPDAAG